MSNDQKGKEGIQADLSIGKGKSNSQTQKTGDKRQICKICKDPYLRGKPSDYKDFHKKPKKAYEEKINGFFPASLDIIGIIISSQSS